MGCRLKRAHFFALLLSLVVVLSVQWIGRNMYAIERCEKIYPPGFHNISGHHRCTLQP
jgi:hypothetical protein